MCHVKPRSLDHEVGEPGVGVVRGGRLDVESVTRTSRRGSRATTGRRGTKVWFVDVLGTEVRPSFIGLRFGTSKDSPLPPSTTEGGSGPEG